MNDVWPIFIASKARPEGKTFEVLRKSNLGYTVVLEPQDVDSYKVDYAKNEVIYSLSENNKGIGYVRQSILDLCRKQNIEWYWMLDDDITGFFRAANKRTERITAREALSNCQEALKGLPTVAQAALEYQQFSWSATKPLRWNSYCDVCVAINTERTKKINYRSEYNLKEDRDFTLQVIVNSGYQAVRLTFYSFAAPKNGSNKGGCQDEYKKVGRELEQSQKMVAAWPGICTLNFKSDGRPDVKVNWSLFKTKT